MKTIYSKQNKFQKILDALILLFQLMFGIEPRAARTKPYVFVSPAIERRSAVERAVRAFELKKQGGAAR
jgi:hypothetical protein